MFLLHFLRVGKFFLEIFKQKKPCGGVQGFRIISG